MNWRCLLVLTALAFAASGIARAQTAPLYARNNVLVGANFNDGPGSSDMTLIMRLSSGAKIYVDEGAKVKYVHDPDNKDVKPGWTKIVYDDAKWLDGISGVGFSDNDDNTEVPASRISIWTRYVFDVSDAATIKELILLADYDDQYAAWLNGTLIAESVAGLVPKGGEPKWDVTQGGTPNHGSCELVKGKPNAARWNCARVIKTVVDFKYAGASGFAVDPKGKTAMTWGELKRD